MFPMQVLACVIALYGHVVTYWVVRFDGTREVGEHESLFWA